MWRYGSSEGLTVCSKLPPEARIHESSQDGNDKSEIDLQKMMQDLLSFSNTLLYCTTISASADFQVEVLSQNYKGQGRDWSQITIPEECWSDWCLDSMTSTINARHGLVQYNFSTSLYLTDIAHTSAIKTV